MFIEIEELMAYNVNDDFLELVFATSKIAFRKGTVNACFTDSFPLSGEEGSGVDVHLFCGTELHVRVRSDSFESARVFYEFICKHTGMPNSSTGTNTKSRKKCKA
jgi:hypothetical protein